MNKPIAADKMAQMPAPAPACSREDREGSGMLPEIEILETASERYMCFKTRDLITDHIRKHGQWGRLEVDIAILMSSGLDGAFVLDIGANLGSFSIPVAKRLSAYGTDVYAFEAQRIIFQQLCGNIFLNRVSNCFAYNLAVGASDGIARLPKIDYLRSENIGSVSLLPEIQDVTRVSYSKTEFEDVELKAVDSLKLKDGCSFIKIDVEGFESQVLKGAIGFIEANKFPPVLFEEWRKGKFGGEAGKSVEIRQEETRSLLAGLGYKLLKLGTDTLAQHPESLAQVELELSSDQRGKLVRVR